MKKGTLSLHANLICVLGMHRSGTSAVTGGVAALGADAGDRLMPPAPDNPKGYWEDLDVFSINEEVLHCIRSSWDSSVDFHTLYIEFIPESIYQRAVELIRSKLRDDRAVVIKDPRFCVLLPFWKMVMDEAGCRPVYLFVLRNPLDAARSLQERNGMPLEQGLLLWFYYNALCLKDLNSDCLVVSYEQFMKEPVGELKRISDFAGLDFEAAGETVNDYIKTFLDPALHHNLSQQEELASACEGFFPEIPAMYGKLIAHQNRGPVSSEAINDAFSSFWDCSIFKRIASINESFERRNELTVRFDLGKDFSEESSVTNIIKGSTAHFDVNLSHLGHIERVQVGLGKSQCIVRLDAFHVELPNGEGKDLGQCGGNYALQKGNKYVFDTVGPHLTADVGCPLKTLHFSCSFLGNEMETAVCLLAYYREKTTRNEIQMSETSRELESTRADLESTRTEFGLLENKVSMLSSQLDKANSMAETFTRERDVLETAKRLLEEKMREKTTLLEGELKRHQALLSDSQEILFNKEVAENVRRRRQRAPLRAFRSALLAMLHPFGTRRYLQDKALVMKSGFFVRDYYLENNRDVMKSATDPLSHFLAFGWKEGRSPGPAFDVKYYRERYGDVRKSGINPLIHYIVHGRGEGRFPTLQKEEEKAVNS